MKNALLAGLATLAVVGCTQGQMAQPVPVAVTQNAQTALLAYQSALGLAQVAVRTNPALSDRVAALIAKAQPSVDLASRGVADASVAPTLAALAAQLLIEGAAFITVVPAAPLR